MPPPAEQARRSVLFLLWNRWRFSRAVGIIFTMRGMPYLSSTLHQLPWILGLAIVTAATSPFARYDQASPGLRLVWLG